VQTGSAAPGVDYQFRWLMGDPRAEHRPERAYRAPFASGSRHPVTQAFPAAVTHNTPDSRYAIDLAMPIGTDVYAARSGIVIEVESARFRASITEESEEANLIRILHDDGTIAIYAHLSRSSVRVRSGDRVARGDYIADSGNTGFSSGPHLHFAVTRNAGFRLESVPVEFDDGAGGSLTAQAGTLLQAW
jgi:murein DD-endopeptidase MepM/ murein hydrolase activator NlpD